VKQVPQSPPREHDATRRPAIPFVLVTVLIDMIGVGLMLPVLPMLVGEFTGSREAQTYWYGALAASYGLMLFLCAPGLGALSDRYGRRPILLIGVAGLGTLFLVAALATSLWMLFAARMLAGATGATLAVANAYLADITPPEDRAKQFGRIGAMFGVGFIIGPAAGGMLGAIDVRLPFYAAACLSLANFAYGWFVLPESLPPERRRPFHLARANPIASLTALARLHGVGVLVVVYALINLAQFILHTNWVLYTNFRFDWGPRDSGLSLFVVGLMSVLMQGVLLGRLIRRFGERRMALAGIASWALAFVAWGVATQSWMMYAIIFANPLAFAAAPALQALVSKAADPTEQGRTMGALSSLASLMVVVAPMIGAPVLAEVSHLPAGDWRIGAPFFVSAALQALAFVLAAWQFARRPAAAA
jgi:DHA1 family tetracycline resistance protein-like MFS transporter